MKTAIQKVIEELKSRNVGIQERMDSPNKSAMSDREYVLELGTRLSENLNTLHLLESYLPTEKEQIEQAFGDGLNHFRYNCNRHEYFGQVFNTNKTDLSAIPKLDEVEQTGESGYNGLIGSSHWLRTLLGHVARIGEFMQKHGHNHPDDMTLRKWGQLINEDSRQIIGYFEKTDRLASNIDLNELEKKLDEALSGETGESLHKFIK